MLEKHQILARQFLFFILPRINWNKFVLFEVVELVFDSLKKKID